MNLVQYQVHSVLNRVLLDGLRDRKDLLALQTLTPLSAGYLPWSQAAMRPSGVAALLNDIVINHRRSIVECGSGISTFYIGRLLRNVGGHLYTIEHDEDWAALLQHSLDAEGLAEHVTVIQAPLASTCHSWDGAPWYSEEVLSRALEGRKFDLVIVDGPPGYSKALRHARYPAIPFFKPFLAGDFTIVLDDINRLGEQEIVKRWERQLDIKFERRFVDGTVAIGRRRKSFTV